MEEYLRTALQLQRERCEVYRSWDECFHNTIAGANTAEYLQKTIGETVIPTFQRVSTGLRELQARVRADDSLPSTAAQGLVEMVDALQTVEAEHYQVSVELASAIASHCTLNTTSATTTTVKEGETTPKGRASVHARDLCELPRLLPLPSLQGLHFVPCLDIDLLKGEDDDDEEEEEDTTALSELSVDGSELPVHYSQQQVAARCQQWSHHSVKLAQRKTQLQKEAAALTEDLQCELTDSLTP